MTEPNVPSPGPNDPYDTAPQGAPPPPPNAAMLNPTPTPPPPPPGQTIPYGSAYTGYPGPYMGPPPDQNAKTMGMLCHLLALAGVLIPGVGNWVGPLVIWLLKKQEHPFIDDQGKESLNFQITMLIVAIILSPTLCLVIGFFLLPAVGLVSLIFAIVGAVRVNGGEPYRYPFALRLIK